VSRCGASRLDQPLAGAAELGSRAVHQQMHGLRTGAARARGTSRPTARRDSVVWSGTGRSKPSRRMTEPINPSVWRSASWNSAFRVSAVRIASGKYQAYPPRVVRGAARQAAIASSVNHTVRLPRRRKLASWAGQFITRRFCLGMWWRHLAWALKGPTGIRDQNRSDPSTPHCPVPNEGSQQQSRHLSRGRPPHHSNSGILSANNHGDFNWH
jgi:hypothetical protein